MSRKVLCYMVIPSMYDKTYSSVIADWSSWPSCLHILSHVNQESQNLTLRSGLIVFIFVSPPSCTEWRQKSTVEWVGCVASSLGHETSISSCTKSRWDGGRSRVKVDLEDGSGIRVLTGVSVNIRPLLLFSWTCQTVWKKQSLSPLNCLLVRGRSCLGSQVRSLNLSWSPGRGI